MKGDLQHDPFKERRELFTQSDLLMARYAVSAGISFLQVRLVELQTGSVEFGAQVAQWQSGTEKEIRLPA